jgi:hypothetical protein
MALQNETLASYKGLYTYYSLVVSEMLIKEEYTAAGLAQVTRLSYAVFLIRRWE